MERGAMRATTTMMLLGTLLLAGCQMAQDMVDAGAKSDAVAVALEKDLGAKPRVGWNIHNGTLTNLTVVFPLASVASLPVGDLEARVRAEVTKQFAPPPRQVTLSVVSAP